MGCIRSGMRPFLIVEHRKEWIEESQKILCSIKVVGNHRLFEYVLALDVEGIVRKHLGRSYPRHMETEWENQT